MPGQVNIKCVRGNKGKISGLVGADKTGTTHYIDVQRFTGVGSNPLRVNTAPGDQGHAHYDGTIHTMSLVVRGRVIHSNPLAFLLLGTTAPAVIQLTDGMIFSGSMIAYQAPITWVRSDEAGYIDCVFKAMMNGIYTEDF
jgi:hypothetical protein